MKVHMGAIAFVVAARSAATDDFRGIALDGRFGAGSPRGLADFSHAQVPFLFHEVEAWKVVTGARHPRGNPDWPAAGIFAERGKNRPSRIGGTIRRIVAVEGTRLRVAGLDAIDGTPVLDVKPVIDEFLPRQPAWAGEPMRDDWRPAAGAA